MSERAPSAKPRFSATLPNYKLVFSGWSRNWRGAVASIQQSRGDKVMGGIYELSEQDIARLVQFEGKVKFNIKRHDFKLILVEEGSPETK